MNRTVLALVVTICVLLPCSAKEIDAVLRSCSLATDQQTCEQAQANFRGDWQKASAGDYVGQTTVASSLDDGRSGSVTVNRPISCAWRMVLLSSGSTRITENDALKFDWLCKRKLSDTEMGVARTQASGLYQRVYGRAFPGFF